MSNQEDDKVKKGDDILVGVGQRLANNSEVGATAVVVPTGKLDADSEKADSGASPSRPAGRSPTSKDLIDRVFGDDGGKGTAVVANNIEGEAPRVSVVAAESLPGAFAQAPSTTASSSQRERQPTTRGENEESPNEDVETGTGAAVHQSRDDNQLAVAQLVGESDPDLQEASPIQQEEKNSANGFVAKAAFVLLLFSILIVGILWMTGVFEKHEGDTRDVLHTSTAPGNSPSPSSFPTEEPSLLPLPQFTMETIEQDPDSPQARAYEWLQNDVLLSVPNERQRTQRFALATFFFALEGESWFIQENWLNHSLHECAWKTKPPEPIANSSYGACDEEGNYLSLFMTANGLAGTLPPEITLLTSLQHLDIATNEIEGTIPSELGLMNTLVELTMDNNQMLGVVPTELMQLTNLQVLQLQDNEFTGTFPTEMGQLTNLLEFRWFDSKTGGTMPTEMGLMTSLKTFHVFRNPITGTIPSQIGLLTNIVDFQWSITTHTTGRIPSEIGFLTSLTRLQLEKQALTGSIPTEFGLLKSLSVNVELEMNLLTGTIPTELALLSNLKAFYAFDNQLTGRIPSELGLLSLLSSLDMEINQLTSTLPTELGRTRLSNFWIGGNRLTGTIPTEFGMLSNMMFFMVYSNDITGTIPEELCMGFDLIELFTVASNELTGTLPAECFVNKTNLNQFSINDNHITGQIPSEFGLLPPGVKQLNFANTSLAGPLPLPANVSNLQGLEILNLRGTDLSGEIPDELCAIPDLVFECSGTVLCGCNCTCSDRDI